MSALKRGKKKQTLQYTALLRLQTNWDNTYFAFVKEDLQFTLHKKIIIKPAVTNTVAADI